MRYADDFQLYVGSREAGERVLASLQRYLRDSLKLTVNTHKSAKAIEKLKAVMQGLSRRTRGYSLKQIVAELKKTLLGWKAYFDISEVHPARSGQMDST